MFKREWENHRLQMIGAALLVSATSCSFLGWIMAAWYLLATVGIIDVVLIYVEKDITISKWIRGLSGHKVDNVIMFTLIITVVRVMGWTIGLWFIP